MNRKDKEEMEAGTPTMEDASQLQAQIDKLQEELAQSELRAAMEDVEKIELPVATVMIRTDSQSCIPMQGGIQGSNGDWVAGITPPEALVLAAMHGPKAGGRVFEKITPIGSVTTNAVAEKIRLAAKYGMDRIDKIFPGNEPKLPKNFVLAVRQGLGTALPVQRLFDVKVTAGLPVA